MTKVNNSSHLTFNYPLMALDFWQSPSHFNAVCDPLLQHLSLSNSLASTHVTPALTALAAASLSSAEQLKVINSGILKLMRADSAAVRLAAVKCQRSLTDRLGEEWVALLPEMLPFIAELLEDDDEGVERETRAWIRGVEELVGESLEGMLQ